MELEFVRADETDVAAICALAREHIETYEDLAAIDAEAVFAWMERKTRKRIGEYRRVTCLGETSPTMRKPSFSYSAIARTLRRNT